MRRLAAAGIHKCNMWVYAQNREALDFRHSIGWHVRQVLLIVQRLT